MNTTTNTPAINDDQVATAAGYICDVLELPMAAMHMAIVEGTAYDIGSR